jgi:hypothetical protein
MNPVPINYRLFPTEEAVVANVVGSISFSDMADYLLRLRQDPDYEFNMNSFYDLSQ